MEAAPYLLYCTVMKMKVYLQTSLAEVQSPGTYQLGAANGVPCLVARVALWAGWWWARCRANYAARRCSYCLLSLCCFVRTLTLDTAAAGGGGGGQGMLYGTDVMFCDTICE